MALNCSPDYQINWPFSSGEEMQNRQLMKILHWCAFGEIKFDLTLEKSNTHYLFATSRNIYHLLWV